MDIEWVLYHLIHNDAEFQHLSLDVDFYNDDVWSRLLASLARNSTIESVKVERYQGGDEERTFAELANLFSTLANISSIHTVTISALSSDDFTAALDLLRHENLRVCHLDLTGGEDGTILPAQVGLALSQAPQLIELLLEDPLDVDCEVWLSSILQSSSLKKLTVETYNGIRLDPGARPIFSALQQNSVLYEFSLGYLLDERTSQFVADTIRWNSSLKIICLSIVSCEEQTYLDLLDALQQNHTLSTFENCTASAVVVSVEIEQRQQEMLEANHHLEFLSLFRDTPDFLKKKSMYLQLNAAGRHRLFHQDSYQTVRLQDWLDVMVGTSDSLDCLYYCLSSNPSLCKSMSEEEERCPVGKRKRSISPVSTNNPTCQF